MPCNVWVIYRTVREARTIVEIAARSDMTGQAEIEARVKGVTLVMIEQKIAALRRGKIGQSLP